MGPGWAGARGVSLPGMREQPVCVRVPLLHACKHMCVRVSVCVCVVESAQRNRVARQPVARSWRAILSCSEWQQQPSGEAKGAAASLHSVAPGWPRYPVPTARLPRSTGLGISPPSSALLCVTRLGMATSKTW